MLWTIVVSALEGLKVHIEVVIIDYIDNNMKTNNGFMKYLKESCRLCSD